VFPHFLLFVKFLYTWSLNSDLFSTLFYHDDDDDDNVVVVVVEEEGGGGGRRKVLEHNCLTLHSVKLIKNPTTKN